MKNQQIKVCGMDIEQIYDDPKAWAANGMGRTDPIKGEILIRNDLHADQAILTLMHELLHMILDNSGFYDLGKDEVFVSVMATQLICLLHDNPKLISTWQEVWTMNEKANK